MLPLDPSQAERAVAIAALALFQTNCTSVSPRHLSVDEPEMAFTSISVIDVNGGPTRDQMTVVVSGRRISAVYPTDARRFPANVRIVDGRGKFLIPGLWDMHVHAFNTPESTLTLGQRATDIYFPQFLASGITGIREMGGWLETVTSIRQRVRAREVFGPRIVAAGRSFGGKNRWAPPSPHVWVVTSADSAPAAVDSMRRAGVDFIKVHDLLSREAYFAIAKRAHELGLPLVGHLRPDVTLEEAIDAGQVGVEHVPIELVVACAGGGTPVANEFYAQWIKGGWSAFVRRTAELWASRDPSLCSRIMSRMREAGVRVTPTLILRMQDSSLLGRIPLNALTSANAKRCVSDVADWGSSSDSLRALYYRTVFEVVGTLHAAGVQLLAGSDGPGGCLAPGIALHQELENLVRAGLTPVEALLAATLEPARFLGLADSLGTIQAGKVADLVMLDADPLIDIRNTRRIVGVVADGRWLDHSELNRMEQRARAILAR